MTTTRQHINSYELWTETAEKFYDVANSLATDGETDASREVRARGDKYAALAEQAVLDAAADITAKQTPSSRCPVPPAP